MCEERRGGGRVLRELSLTKRVGVRYIGPSADLVLPAHCLRTPLPPAPVTARSVGGQNQGWLCAKYALWPGSTGPSVLAHAQWAAEENSPCMLGVCVILTQQAVRRSRVGQTKPKL